MSLEALSRSFRILDEGKRKQPGQKRVLDVSAPDTPPRWGGPCNPETPRSVGDGDPWRVQGHHLARSP